MLMASCPFQQPVCTQNVMSMPAARPKHGRDLGAELLKPAPKVRDVIEIAFEPFGNLLVRQTLSEQLLRVQPLIYELLVVRAKTSLLNDSCGAGVTGR